mgnify:CR=1 FL=1
MQELIVQKCEGDYHTVRMKNNPFLKANHRQILRTEVVIDIDCKEPGKCAKIMDMVSSELLKDKIEHTVWKTGGKGYHIHCFFTQLALFDFDARREIRKQFLKQYCSLELKWDTDEPEKVIQYIDIQKTSELVMIRMEEGKHEKTGLYKTNIYETKNMVNDALPDKVVKKANEVLGRINKKTEFNRPIIDATDIIISPFFKYILHNKLPEGERHNVALKNVAAALFNIGVKGDDLEQMIQNIADAQNSSSMPCNEVKKALKSWMLYFETRGEATYSIIEINKYVAKYKLQLMVEVQ